MTDRDLGLPEIELADLPALTQLASPEHCLSAAAGTKGNDAGLVFMFVPRIAATKVNSLVRE